MGKKKKKLHRSLQLYFSKKLKKIPTIHLPNNPTTTTSTTSWFLSACKYPKTPSFAESRDAAGDHAATLSDVDRFLFDNFRSLYVNDGDYNSPTDDATSDSSSPPRYDTDRPIRPSDRFFVSKSASSSVVEESLSLSSSSSSSTGDGVAVMTLSKEPYEDFRRSMQEMVDARHVDKYCPLDWDFMEELLFCYLELNDKRVHKFILRAFVDLSVSFEGRRENNPSRKKELKKVEREGEEEVAAVST
ncbi:transcription repressor OFP14-like [Typha angustifolia]|uniref:transcription repressor OFP14-like n=1 Tax=Typha angustifolia TaxID=59011 RepID=UPI003C2F46DC